MIILMKTKGITAFLTAFILISPLSAAGQDDFSASFRDPYAAFETEGDLSGDKAEYTMWKNDELVLKAMIKSETDAVLSVSAGPLENETGMIPDSVSVSLLEEVNASSGMGDTPAKHIAVPDLVTEKTDVPVSAGEETYLFIRVKVPAEAPDGTYRADIMIDSQPVLELTVQVEDLVLPDSEFTFELWQYPYSALRYYDCLEGEAAFSEKHLAVLEKQMSCYHSLGGENITVTITDCPWGSQTYDPYPSMVKWNRKENGELTFDYTDMDTWITFCESCGIDERIDAFGILPFSKEISVTEEDGSVSVLKPDIGSREWEALWTAFLEGFMKHMEEKGWLEKTFLSVDERAEEDIRSVLSLVQKVCGGRLKLSACVAELDEEDFYDSFDRLAVSLGAFRKQEDAMRRIIWRRKEKGLVTLLYTCSGTYPNSFALSQPAESVWTMVYALGLGFDGFLRWAYDAWTEDPYRDLDWMYFEAGDTMLVYPDGKDAEDPDVFPSYRLEMLKQGMRSCTKVSYLKENLPDEDSLLLEEIMSSLYRGSGVWNTYGAMTAKNRNTDRLTYLEVRKAEEAVNAGAAILQGDVSGHDVLKKLAGKKSLLEKTGIDISWDGMYLGYGKSLGIANIAALVYALVLSLFLILKRPEKRKTAGLLIAGEVLLSLLYSGGELVLFDARTPLHMTLCLVITVLLSVKKKLPAPAGEEEHV